MMKTLLALLVAASAALAQDEPKDPPKREPPRPVRPPPPPQDGPREGRPPLPPNPPDLPGNPGERRVPPPFDPEAVRNWLRENEPETFRRLNDAQSTNHRDEAQQILAQAAPRMREMNELKQRDPKALEKLVELRHLERESMTQAEQARNAAPEDREAASKKLKETLSKLFDLREENRLRELTELKRRVDALEKAMGDRKASKEKIVERRRRELMGEKSEDDW